MSNADLCSAALVIFFFCTLMWLMISAALSPRENGVKCRCMRSDAITGGAAASAASASTGATFSRLTFSFASHAGRESVDRLWAALSTQNRLRHQLEARALNACYSSPSRFVSHSLRMWEETKKDQELLRAWAANMRVMYGWFWQKNCKDLRLDVTAAKLRRHVLWQLASDCIELKSGLLFIWCKLIVTVILWQQQTTKCVTQSKVSCRCWKCNK